MSAQNIKTVVLCMLENRSFDNMLGHLSFEGILTDANGLTPPLARDEYANPFQGTLFHPFHRPLDEQLQSDLPHEYNYVSTQLAAGSNGPTNTGFVQAYADLTKQSPNLNADPMCFYGSEQVPITSWLARNFCTCDSWFCPLPTSTQPNRTVAFCGHSKIFETKLQPIPAEGNIFDWLNKNNITWGVYHDGFTFFALYPDLLPHILFSKKFHPYEQLGTDIKNNKQPQVIIVEPSYQDAPHVGPDYPNDNHPPLAVGWGEEFLRRTYQALTMNTAVWEGALMIVYNDEHGGFYDHVPPPAFDNAAAGNAEPPQVKFNTLGPRVPGILVSPWVVPGKINHELHDHTSVLRLLAEVFTPGTAFSAQVASRASQGIRSLSAALTDAPVQTQPPPPPASPIFAKSLLGDTVAKAPESGMAQSLENAALKMLKENPDEVDTQFPLLNNWKVAVLQARPESIPAEFKE